MNQAYFQEGTHRVRLSVVAFIGDCNKSYTRSSAIAEIPRDALRHVKSGLGVAEGRWKMEIV